jgi:two-component system, LytTR family, sensor kinase
MVKSKFFRWLLHGIGWTVFFLLPVIATDHRQVPGETGFTLPTPPISMHIITDVSLLVLFYLNYLLLFPHYFNRKKFLHYAFALFNVTLAIYLLQDYLRFQFLILPWVGEAKEYYPHFGPFMSMFLLIAVLGTGIRMAEEWLKGEQLNKEREKEKVQAELASLKSQINPHFLFNALNTIYSLTVTESQKASEAVLNLSKMMRYVMQDAQGDYVPLKDEINHLENFIDFQKLRATQKLTIEYFKHVDDNTAYKIAPLVLIPFIENAFKYGVSAHDESTIEIQLFAENGKLSLDVSNKIFQSQTLFEANSGIGLNNTTRRLELIYPGKHKLMITEKEGVYAVELKIDLS